MFLFYFFIILTKYKGFEKKKPRKMHYFVSVGLDILISVNLTTTIERLVVINLFMQV